MATDFQEISFDTETFGSGLRKSARRLIPEKHLQSPIITTLLDRLDDTVARYLREKPSAAWIGGANSLASKIATHFRGDPSINYGGFLPKLAAYCEVMRLNNRRTPQQLTPRLYPHLTKYGYSRSADLISDIEEANRVSDIEIDAYLAWCSDLLKPEEKVQLKQRLVQRADISPDTLEWGRRAELWSDIVEKSRSHYASGSRSLVPINYGSLKVLLGPGYSGLFVKGQWLTAVWEQLQAIQDTARARFNTLLALDLGLHNGSTELHSLVRRQLAWSDECIERYGNEGYALVKAPEAVMKSHLTSLSGGDIITPSTFNRTIRKLAAKEAPMDAAYPLTLKLQDIAHDVHSMHDAAELFGICKLSGHPAVFAARSGRAVQDGACRQNRAMYSAVWQNMRFFRHMTIAAYIDEHHDWPPFKNPPRPGSMLHRLWAQRSTSISLGSYPLHELDAIRFDDFMTFDYHGDYLDFLDDKAICPGVREAPNFWFSSEQTGVPASRSRRVLLHALKEGKISTYDIVERLRDRRFHADEMIVELTQKEREFKMAARCYAKMTFEVRLYWIILEANLKRFGEKYFRQQTMTMSEAEEKTRLYQIAKEWDSPNSALTEFDFSTWNNLWNQRNTGRIAADLNDIYGMPGAWSQIHWFFEHSTIVVTDKNYLPPGASPQIPITQWPPSDVLWRGTHIGGLEGIQQFFWTICTVVLMTWSLSDQDASFLMAGQGDNQIFHLRFDLKGRSLATALSDLLAVVEVRAYTMNHDIKPEECIDSRSVITYSKELYVRGVHVMYTLKFASRSFSREDRTAPSLTREISGVSSCALMVADALREPIRAVQWKNILLRLLLRERSQSYVHALERPHLRRILGNRSLYAFVSLIPSSLGGLPTLPWTRFFMKGETDPLSWDLGALWWVNRQCPVVGRFLRVMLAGRFTPEHPDPTKLLADPYSLPLSCPTDKTELIREATTEALPSITLNRDLREILSCNDLATDLAAVLSRATPLFPDLMGDLLSYTPVGLRERLLGRFVMARTVADVSDRDFSHSVRNANAAILRDICGRFDYVNRLAARDPKLRGSHLLRPFQLGCKLRALWGNGLKHADIGAYTPFDYRLGKRQRAEPWISCATERVGIDLTRVRGSKPPNFGTQTRAKVSRHGFRIETTGGTISDLRALTLLYTMLGSDPTLAALCSQLTQLRCPWSVQALGTVLPTAIGGCASHRHIRINTARFSVLGSRTTPTNLSLSSDDSGLLSGGLDDYPVPFQAFYLTLTTVAAQLGEAGLLPTRTEFGVMLEDDYEPISNTPVTVDPGVVRGTALLGNPLAYVSQLTTSSVPKRPPTTLAPPLTTPSAMPAALIYSYALSELPRVIRSCRGGDTLTLPISLMDMKELACCPLTALITGLSAYIVADSLYQASRTGSLDQHILHSAMRASADAVSGLVVRSVNHPLIRGLDLTRLTGLIMSPGRGGAKRARMKCREMLLAEIGTSLQWRVWKDNFPLLLFEDYPPAEARLTLSHALLMLACGGRPGTRQTKVRRAHVHDLKQSIHGLTGTRKVTEALRAGVLYMQGLRTGSPIRRAVDCGRVLFRYVSLEPKHALRSLRSLVLRRRAITVRATPTIINNCASPRIKFRPTMMEGRRDVACRHRRPADDVLRAELALSSLRRQRGSYSSIQSDWLYLFNMHRSTVGGVDVLNVGVGSGGAVVAAIQNGASLVQGVDLRSTFPQIPQRESTYTPPAIVYETLDSLFVWHAHTRSSDGNLFTLPDLAEWSGTVILDVDLPLSDLLVTLPKFRGSGYLWIRARACNELIAALAAVQPVQAAYNLSALPELEEPIRGILLRRSDIVDAPPNAAKLVVASSPMPNYSVQSSSRESCQYVCHLLRVPLTLLPDLTDASIQTAIDEMRQRILYPDPTEACLEQLRTFSLLESLQDLLQEPVHHRDCLARYPKDVIRAAYRIQGLRGLVASRTDLHTQ
jgi:hypothetical protein